MCTIPNSFLVNVRTDLRKIDFNLLSCYLAKLFSITLGLLALSSDRSSVVTLGVTCREEASGGIKDRAHVIPFT
jgi:hypothetical protein